jgi:xanthine dehydrogenase accessory factor
VATRERDPVATSDRDPVATIATTLSDRLAADLDARIATGESGLSVIDCDGDLVETFFEVSVPPAHLIIFGAMEFSSALAAAALPLGYHVTVCDPRPLFATARRFPAAEVVVEWPTVWFARQHLDERTVICILSHDARFDAELVALALASPAGYVGAMGSRATHDRRLASLRERGVTDEQIARLHSPIGLDIGASTVEETAIAILGEVIAARTGATARPLVTTAGAIHRSRLTGARTSEIRLDAQKSRSQKADNHPSATP